MKKALLATLLTLLLAGCKDEASLGDRSTVPTDGPAEGSAVTTKYVGIETLAIRPAYVTIVGLGSTVQLTADVWFEDGSLSEDAMDSVMPPALTEAEAETEPDPIPLEWSTENYGIADVDASGLVTAVSSGATYIHVRVDGHEALSRVIVHSTSSMDPNIDSTDLP